ncbi:MAG: trp RNA-binding attenuation protein MtrB [Clostridia bacterium]|nr:trp RNA-binding attenuation protein MtrB [Clostridia bacterium]
MDESVVAGQYIVVKANKDGVKVIGMTRGKDTKFHHTEKLNKGEVMICQFTQDTSAIKINGASTIITEYGEVTSDDE